MTNRRLAGSGLILLTLLLAAGCQQQAGGEGKAAGPLTAGQTGFIDTPSATVVVHGMGCPQCASSVDRLLMDVPGVRDVSVDLGSGQVKVAFDDPLRPTREQLADAVRKSGYKLVRIDTP